MPNHASATIIGHLGRDPETRSSQGGALIFNATLAVSTGYGSNKRTTWWRVNAFGKTAETLERFNLTKGEAIGFVGMPSIREWEDSENNKRQSLELDASNFILLGRNEEAPKPANKAVSEDAPFDDEIPF